MPTVDDASGPGAPLALVVNGEARTTAPGTTLAGLLESLGHHPRTVAVERNGEIVPRARLASTELADGDRLEIVRFVQGG